MALQSALKVGDKLYWQRDIGVINSVTGLCKTLADAIDNEVGYGIDHSLGEAPDEGFTDPRDQLVFKRNNAMQTYWSQRRGAASRLQSADNKDPLFEVIVIVLVNGLEILTPLGGTMVTGNTREGELLQAMFLSADILVNNQLNGLLVPPDRILTPTDLEPSYDEYWSNSKDPSFNRTDPTTWGDFVVPAYYSEYYVITNWHSHINQNTEIKKNLKSTEEPA